VLLARLSGLALLMMVHGTGERQTRIRLIRRNFLGPSSGIARDAHKPSRERGRVAGTIRLDAFLARQNAARRAVLRPAVTRPAKREIRATPTALQLVTLHPACARLSFSWTETAKREMLTASTACATSRSARSIEKAD
jgi:hypothetical protein